MTTIHLGQAKSGDFQVSSFDPERQVDSTKEESSEELGQGKDQERDHNREKKKVDLDRESQTSNSEEATTKRDRKSVESESYFSTDSGGQCLAHQRDWSLSKDTYKQGTKGFSSTNSLNNKIIVRKISGSISGEFVKQFRRHHHHHHQFNQYQYNRRRHQHSFGPKDCSNFLRDQTKTSSSISTSSTTSSLDQHSDICRKHQESHRELNKFTGIRATNDDLSGPTLAGCVGDSVNRASPDSGHNLGQNRTVLIKHKRAQNSNQKQEQDRVCLGSPDEGSVRQTIYDSTEKLADIESKSLMDSVSLNWKGSSILEMSPFTMDTNVNSCRLASKKLRELAAHLEHGSVPQPILYQTLEYAVSVLDSVTMDQISRISDEEDGDLSEVQSDSIPTEVRKWLETTFTRNSISQKCRSEDKLKFRSVANAIRAGIVVDRIYRRTSASIPVISPEVSNLLLKSIDDWSFDCFNINQISNGQVLKSVGYELFQRYGLIYKFKIPIQTLKNFLTQIELGYVKHKNPYHNNMHAADVTQTVHYMLWRAGLTNWLTDLEIFAILLAAIIHDYLHTGTTNNFHVMSQSDTALLYNDRAVLENFHISQAFTLLKNEDCNILAGLSKDEYREFRSLVIDMVLATDMSSHFQQIKAMKNILNHSDNFNADKSKVLSLVIHISDISHPAKEWELHSQWTHLLMEEFFRQGDREKELDLECSPLCDRETTLVPESQLGFIEFIVSPSLELCGDVMDRVHGQIAEMNARPVLPPGSKANSIVLFGKGETNSSSGQIIQDQPSTEITSLNKNENKNFDSNLTSDQNTIEGESILSTVSPSSGTTIKQQTRERQTLSSQISSETLASNLRKMIVSSSASIGRKLGNISVASTVSSIAPKANFKTSIVEPSGSHVTAQAQTSSITRQTKPVIELRKATEYKHPVIMPESPVGRPRTATAVFRTDSRSSEKESDESMVGIRSESRGTRSDFGDRDESAQNDDDAQTGRNISVSNQTGDRSIKMGEITTLNSPNSQIFRQTSLSAPQLSLLKIQRPWVACLERNKRMWQERAAKEAQARESKRAMEG